MGSISNTIINSVDRLLRMAVAVAEGVNTSVYHTLKTRKCHFIIPITTCSFIISIQKKLFSHSRSFKIKTIDEIQ